MFFCGAGDGEKLFDPGSSGRKGGMSAGNPDQRVYVYAVFSSLILTLYRRRIAIPGSPYRRQNGKIRKMTFFGGSEMPFWGVPLGTISMGYVIFLIFPF